MRPLFAVLVLLAASAEAHDFWIEPSSFTPAAGQIVSLRLRVGEHLRGEPVPRRPERIERFFARDGSGEREVPGRENRDPAGILTIGDAGTTIVAYRSRPTLHEPQAAGAFERYLREEGLERVIEQRKKRGESSKAGTEIYSRAAKSLLRTGGGEPADRVLGRRREIVRSGDAFRVLFEGQPLANALVVALRRGAEASPLRARSDAEGRVVYPKLSSGMWLVKTVHMVPAPTSAGADWESIWASETFAVP